MRKELLGFLAAALEHLARAGGVADMAPAERMTFTALRDELRCAGTFVRLYIAEPSMVPEDPYALVLALLQHCAFSRVGGCVAVPEGGEVVKEEVEGQVFCPKRLLPGPAARAETTSRPGMATSGLMRPSRAGPGLEKSARQRAL
jgi:hypothetical protein